MGKFHFGFLMVLAGALFLTQSCGLRNQLVVPAAPLLATPTPAGVNTPTPTPLLPVPTAAPVNPVYLTDWSYHSPSAAFYAAYTPYGGGKIYLADGGDHEIQTFTTSGGLPGVIGSGFLNQPLGIAADSAGNVYVSNNVLHNSIIMKFSPAGTLLWSTDTGFGTGNGAFDYPGTIGLDGIGNLYVADQGNNRVEIISAGNGAYAGQWNGAPNHTFPGASYVLAVDAANSFVYLTTSATTITKFTTAGVYVTQWSDPLSSFSDLAVDPATGNVLATDENNYDLRIYSPTGALLGSVGSFGGGTANSQFAAASPSGVAADSSGNFYLVDYGINEIKVFSP
jgi:hypothetical protein